MFDALVREVASRFNLGPQANALVRETLRMITATPGGIGGFLDKFRNIGLGGLVSSWLVNTENAPLTTEQLEKAVGPASIEAVGRKVGLTPAAVAPPLAFLIPKMIDLLTPDGHVPEGVPAPVSAFLAGGGGAAVPPTGKHETRRSGFGPWLWALLGLLVLGSLVWWFLGRPVEEVAVKPQAVQPSTTQPMPAPPPVQPIPSTPARLSLSSTGEKVQFEGVVGDEATRTGILGALQQAFGAGNYTGDIAVDPKVAPAPWLGKLGAALQKLKIPGLDALFEGDHISLGGTIPGSELDSLKGELASLFGPDISVGSLADRAAAWFSDAKSRTLAALAALQPGYSGTDLVGALNLAIINFETGSAQITPDNQELLGKAAAAIKNAPAGTRIQVAGHTDSTGDPQANMQLSQQRAESVRAALVEIGVDPGMLTAQGYGDTKPIASNATPDGRYRNRRIEFIVIH